MQLFCCMLGAVAYPLAAPVEAGFVTLHESELDQIYSQPSFDGSPIDIRYNPTLTLVEPSLLMINSEAKLDQLFSLGPASSPTVNLFFVDGISDCGGVELPAIIGCGSQSGNHIVVDSNFAAKTPTAPSTVGLGAILIGHEFGHNLGLDHVPQTSTNLMTPSVTDSFFLSADPASVAGNQIATILASPLVQMDGGQRFISITPIAVVVPEPASLLFALAGGLWLLWVAGRRRVV